jgi:hypothetical protein
MSGSRGKHGDIARPYFQDLALPAAKLNFSFAGGDSERLVGLGMVVNKIIDSVPPRAAPSMSCEQPFERRGGIDLILGFDSACEQEKRPERMIWNQTIVAKAEFSWLHRGHSLFLPETAPVSGVASAAVKRWLSRGSIDGRLLST